jgi:hypothetical protein
MTPLRAGAQYRQVYRSDVKGRIPIIKGLGLIRVQWGGPWTKPGVPMRVRYRHTHWAAIRNNNTEVFDINAMCVGGWMKTSEWEYQLIPWLIKECVPKADGSWWITHALEVTQNDRRSGTAAEAGVACKDDVRVFINGQLRGVAAVAWIAWFGNPFMSSPAYKL